MPEALEGWADSLVNRLIGELVNRLADELMSEFASSLISIFASPPKAVPEALEG